MRARVEKRSVLGWNKSLCLLFKTDKVILKFFTAYLLSQNNSAGPSTCTPKHLNLYCRALIMSVAILREINSDPKS